MALADIHDVCAYIAFDNLNAADRLFDVIHAACDRLSQMPELGPQVDEIRSVPELRRCVIFDAPMPDGIEVVRELYGARAWETFFGD